MIYMEPSQLGWQPVFNSWLKTLPEVIDTAARDFITEAAKSMFPAALQFVRKKCREYAATSSIMLVVGFQRLLQSLLAQIDDAQLKGKTGLSLVKGSFLFAFVWTFGATGDTDSRAKFDIFMRALYTGADEEFKVTVPFDIPVPDEATVYDYVFEVCVCVW
jgi:dynein heavy chain, axonemal